MTLIFLLLFMSSRPVQAYDSSQTAFVGCLSRLPVGTLQLGVIPSGKVYSIEGDTQQLTGHVNQLVRVLGRAKPSGNRDNTSKLTVSAVEVLAETCTAGLPASKTQTVVGKAGEGQVAAPATTTASSDQTTPGFQTEGAMIQLSEEGRRSAQSLRPATPPYSPLEPEQIAQSEAAANVNAEAALRAEILPGNTLGASGTAPNPAAGSTVAKSNPSSATTSPATRVVNITGGQIPTLSPQRVTIRVGETIQWKNSSPSNHEIVANPAKARVQLVPSLPAGASPFESGFLRPDHTFSYRFTVPGVYRYILDLNSGQPVIGEIVVAP